VGKKINTMVMKFMEDCLPITTNVSRLGEVGDFENGTLKLLLNLNRCTNVQ